MAPNFLSVTWFEETFHGLGVEHVESFILVSALFLRDGGWRREKKKKEEKRNKNHPGEGRRVSLELDPLCWLYSRSQLLGEIKG
jgi:hypothetical protein